MISLFVIMVIIIALAAGAGYGLIALVRSTETSLLVQRNQVRMDTVANMIRSYVRVNGGQVLVPATVDGGTYVARAPSFSPFNTTTWGKPIVYCPVRVSGSGTLDASISMGAAGSYPVSIVNLNGKPYVSNGGPALDASTLAALSAGGRHEGIVAFVISPEISGSVVPSCAQVRLASDNSTFVVDGGIVTAIYYAADQASATTRQVVFSADGSLPSGAAPGTQVVSSIEQLTETITRLGLSDTTVRFYDDSAKPLESQNFVKSEDMVELAAASSGRTIRLVGGADAKLRVLHGTSPAGAMSIFRADGVMEMRDIELEGWVGTGPAAAVKSVDVGFAAGPTGKVSLKGTILGAIRNLGGEVSILTGVSVRPLYSSATAGDPGARTHPILGSGGRIFIDGGSPSLVVSPTAVAGVYVRGGDVTVYGPVGMTVDTDEEAFWSDGGGRVLPATTAATVSVNGGAPVPVMGAATFGTKGSVDPEPVDITGNGVGRSLVVSATLACADGSNDCTATCPTDSLVAWGECGSSNGFALSGFGADVTGRQWTCRWASPSAVTAPTAKAVCAKLP